MKDFDTRDSSNRNSTDVELREAGFHIYSRPEKGEPIWERDGKRYKQSEILIPFRRTGD